MSEEGRETMQQELMDRAKGRRFSTPRPFSCPPSLRVCREALISGK
jgi:hypothetical protein